jgi:hypothetical protein
MAGYKELDFNERRAASQKARADALAKLKSRPPIDEAEQARRRAVREAREEAQAQKRRAAEEAKREAEEAAKAAEERAKEEAAAAQERAKQEAAAAAVAAQLTEEQKKAARDAKYAARKNNKNKGRR